MFASFTSFIVRLFTPATIAPVQEAPKKRASTPKPSLLPPDQAAVIAHALAGLRELCTRSARARDLSLFYHTNAIEAEIVPEGMKVDSAPDHRFPFLVVGIPQDHTADLTKKSFTGARFVGHGAAMAMIELRGTQMSLLGAGLMLAHELTHAQEHFLHNEPASDFPDPNWLMGEIVAHRSIFRVLSEYTDRAWVRLIEERIRRDEAYLESQGKDQKLALFNHGKTNVDAIRSIFPGIDDVTIGLLLAQFDADTNMMRVDRWCDRLGIEERDRRLIAISTMRSFYELMEYTAGR